VAIFGNTLALIFAIEKIGASHSEAVGCAREELKTEPPLKPFLQDCFFFCCGSLEEAGKECRGSI
jgi:hypothetical protein